MKLRSPQSHMLPQPVPGLNSTSAAPREMGKQDPHGGRLLRFKTKGGGGGANGIPLKTTLRCGLNGCFVQLDVITEAPLKDKVCYPPEH